MFSSVARLASSAARGFVLNGSMVRPGAVAVGQATRGMSHGSTESDEDFDARYEAFFNKPDIDGWEIRKAMNDLSGMDLVPEPKIINAALRACRRVNDYALAVRYLESLRFKCGDLESKIYPYIIQEITPTLNELGIDTPEKLGYDKPELALKSVYDM
ncbi:cytochrome C oxidase [Nesidiocoris tenuis]|uniref:Cytochrome c oxidase subunit 5A, mitochondrial n=1 Tax=Nesidiocoris tenuis TaxID=355587 RepID=A0ABN7AF62_9HEMI|nr:cytochrome C oxidase [Nesidiocoris tenuis]